VVRATLSSEAVRVRPQRILPAGRGRWRWMKCPLINISSIHRLKSESRHIYIPRTRIATFLFYDYHGRNTWLCEGDDRKCQISPRLSSFALFG
jgi:hypothetical protein